MTIKFLRSAAFLVSLATMLSANVRAATLKVGDAAPKLRVGKWVQGDPVKEFEPGKAYIVEFWATWCGPCRVSIPHLNELHNAFKDKGLIVIGQDCWENDESLVAPFIKKMDDKMTYRVALDDKKDSEKGKMAETWMEAAGQNGIPSAFVIDKQGKIAWIGHPMGLKEALLQQVLDGKFDVKKEAADFERRQADQEKSMGLSRQLNRSMKDKDWDKAEATLAEMEKNLPADERNNLAPVRFNILLGKEDYTAATKLAAELSESHKNDAMLQNQLAWDLVTHEGIKEKELKMAQKLASRANEAAKGNDPSILDTLARVTFMQGDKDKAIELQEKAVKLADGGLKSQLETVLKSYKEGKLPPSN